MLTAVCAAGMAALLSCAVRAEDTSESAYIFLDPARSMLWSTIPGATMAVPVAFPNGATAATLIITGERGFYRNHLVQPADVNSQGLYNLNFTIPTKASDEDIYTFTLTFDDPQHTTRTAKLALVRGVAQGDEAVARCLAPADDVDWNRLDRGRAVLPIPYGATSLTVNGTPVTLNGTVGWHYLSARNAELEVTAPEGDFAAELIGFFPGSMLIFQ